MRRAGGLNRFSGGANYEEAYEAHSLVTYLKYYALKIVTIQTLIPQMLLLVLFTLSAFPLYTGLGAANALLFSVRRDVLAEDNSFRSIKTASDWYEWLNTSVTNIMRERNDVIPHSGCCRLFVAGVVVRQYRERPEYCDANNNNKLRRFFVNRGTNNNNNGAGGVVSAPRLPLFCYDTAFDSDGILHSPIIPQFSASPVSSASVSSINVTEMAWMGRNNASFRYPSFPAVPSMHSLTRRFGGDEYSALLLIETSKANVSLATLQRAVAELRDGHWLQQGTLAVVTDVVAYHSQHDLFLHVSAVMEISTSAFMYTTMYGDFFQLPSTEDANVFGVLGLVVNLLVAICWCYLVLEVLYRLALQRELKGGSSRWLISVVGLADLFSIVTVLLVGAVLGIRFYLVHAALHRPSAVTPAAAQVAEQQQSQLEWASYLAHVGSMYRLLTTFTSWALFAVFMRLMFFFRYYTRLSLVSETLISGAHEFAGICSVALLVLLAYSLTGHVLWATTNTGFRTFGGSMMMLFSIMISLEIDDYDVYVRQNPASSPVFFLSFFLVAWCVILNVAVGILATSFAAALETQTFIRRPDWSLRAIGRDMLSLLRRLKQPAASTAAAARADGGAALYKPDPPYSLLFSLFLPLTRPAVLQSILLIRGLRTMERLHEERHSSSNSSSSEKGRESSGTETAPSPLLEHRPETSAMVTSSQVQQHSLFAASQLRVICAKALLHVGLHDAKLRQWKMLQRAVEGGKDIATQMSTQYRQLQEICESLVVETGDAGFTTVAVGRTAGSGNSPSGATSEQTSRATEGTGVMDGAESEAEASRRRNQQKEAERQQYDTVLAPVRAELQRLFASVQCVCASGDERAHALSRLNRSIDALVDQIEDVVETLSQRQ